MTYFYEPRLGHQLPHDPFNAIVGPRPIGWVSSQSAEGILNLAPYSFFNAFNYIPPLIASPALGAKIHSTTLKPRANLYGTWSLARKLKP